MSGSSRAISSGHDRRQGGREIRGDGEQVVRARAGAFVQMHANVVVESKVPAVAAEQDDENGGAAGRCFPAFRVMRVDRVHMGRDPFGFGDGRVVHMFECERSVQWRFRKIIAEAPAPRARSGGSRSGYRDDHRPRPGRLSTQACCRRRPLRADAGAHSAPGPRDRMPTPCGKYRPQLHARAGPAGGAGVSPGAGRMPDRYRGEPRQSGAHAVRSPPAGISASSSLSCVPGQNATLIVSASPCVITFPVEVPTSVPVIVVPSAP